MPTYDPKKYHAYYPGTLTRTVHYLDKLGIRSREDLLNLFDDDATGKQFEVFDGVGPRIAEMLVWLRGKTIDDWRRLTNLPAFNDPDIERGSKGGADLSAINERQKQAFADDEKRDSLTRYGNEVQDGATAPQGLADIQQELAKDAEEEPPSTAGQDWG